MAGFRLIATGRALPARCVTNEELCRTVDTSDEWIRTRTGISSRWFCGEEENAATLAVRAAQTALSRAGIAPEEIGCCVCATLSAPNATPSVACQVHAALSLPEDTPALDVNAACSGFLYGITAAAGLMEVNDRPYALVLGCEHLSKLMDMDDRTTCVLFGDGAGAAILLRDDSAPLYASLGARYSTDLTAGGSGPRFSPIEMDGQAVFRFAVEAMPRCLSEVLSRADRTLDEIDWVVCHQANERIIDHCVRKLRAPAEKFYKNMSRYGNTSAASIPIALAELDENGLLRPGQRVVCVGFGGGLTWAGLLLTVGGDTNAAE